MFPKASIHKLVWLGLCVFASLLAACGGGANPQLIGSYPKGPASSPTYPPPPANLLVVHNAYLELEVGSTDAAAQRATQLADDYGGYLVSSQSWYADSRKYTTLTLAVPVAQFETLRQSLLSLGSLVGERVSSDVVSITGHGADAWNTFSTITVQFRPALPSFSLPSVTGPGWNPARTFEQAFRVFASIFTFLVDIVIWVVVVVGPFALMGLGLRALLRRLRAR